MASSGVIFIWMQAVEITKLMFPDGEEPGLKSLAKANGKPFEIIWRAGA